MPWHQGSDRYYGEHRCRKPGKLRVKLHALNDVWECPKCHTRWKLLDYGVSFMDEYPECDPQWEELSGM